MNGLSGVAGSNYYSQISSGTRINTAADGASEMAIIQKETAQINGYEAGRKNAEDGNSLLNVADGAMSGITDSLQRIRELAIQASNTAIVSDSDREAIQHEVDQLKQNISDIANNTEFNTKKLLDGTEKELYIATGANGEGRNINLGDSTLKALGIEDFDVTKDFSVQTINDALTKVSSNRSSIGAQSNSLDYTIGYNMQTSYNLTAARSQMEDTDIEKTISEMDKERTLQNYRFIMQKKQAEQEQKKLTMFYM